MRSFNDWSRIFTHDIKPKTIQAKQDEELRLKWIAWWWLGWRRWTWSMMRDGSVDDGCLMGNSGKEIEWSSLFNLLGLRFIQVDRGETESSWFKFLVWWSSIDRFSKIKSWVLAKFERLNLVLMGEGGSWFDSRVWRSGWCKSKLVWWEALRWIWLRFERVDWEELMGWWSLRLNEWDWGSTAIQDDGLGKPISRFESDEEVLRVEDGLSEGEEELKFKDE